MRSQRGIPPLEPTPAIQARIVRLVRAGNYLSVACRASGVPAEVGEAWCRRSREPGRPWGDRFRRFTRAVVRAELEAEAEALGTVLKAAARGDAESIAWLRSRPCYQPALFEPAMRPSSHSALMLGLQVLRGLRSRASERVSAGSVDRRAR
jgi:hypothetical protein